MSTKNQKITKNTTNHHPCKQGVPFNHHNTYDLTPIEWSTDEDDVLHDFTTCPRWMNLILPCGGDA